MSTPRCIFYDIKSSNNGARIRLWIRLKNLQHIIETKITDFAEMKSETYAKINPLKKIPAMVVTDRGTNLFESFVIMEYLEDRYGSSSSPSFMLDTPEDRAFVHLLVRIHDIYISSPNCTQPNFSHTQGCMYLTPHPTPYWPAERTMNAATRAAKLAEIYKQLNWLEENIRSNPYMAGDRFTHADLTWFPTCVFMEFMLPKVFDWSPIFRETTHFPKLTAWFGTCMENEHFAKTRDEIREELEVFEKRGQFEVIRDDIKKNSEYKWKYI